MVNDGINLELNMTSASLGPRRNIIRQQFITKPLFKSIMCVIWLINFLTVICHAWFGIRLIMIGDINIKIYFYVLWIRQCSCYCCCCYCSCCCCCCCLDSVLAPSGIYDWVNDRRVFHLSIRLRISQSSYIRRVFHLSIRLRISLGSFKLSCVQKWT